MKPIEAIYQRGQLQPLAKLPLQEHQHVWVMIVSEEPTAWDLAQLAAQSPSLEFLSDPAEDLYTPNEGTPL